MNRSLAANTNSIAQNCRSILRDRCMHRVCNSTCACRTSTHQYVNGCKHCLYLASARHPADTSHGSNARSMLLDVHLKRENLAVRSRQIHSVHRTVSIIFKYRSNAVKNRRTALVSSVSHRLQHPVALMVIFLVQAAMPLPCNPSSTDNPIACSTYRLALRLAYRQ